MPLRDLSPTATAPEHLFTLGLGDTRYMVAGSTGPIRTPEQHGATGNGTTDDQTALVAFLAAAQPGERLVMRGRYRHSGVLTFPNVARLTLDAQGSELLATNRLTAALRFVGCDGFTLIAPRHRVNAYNGTDNGGNGRGSDDSSTAPFYFENCTNFTVVDAYSENSAQCGFYLKTCRRYRFVNPVVMRSYADGFHQTHTCTDGLVESPTIWFPGDDGVAVVSYKLDGATAVGPCARIRVHRPTVRHCHARGVSIVGGTDIIYTDVDVQWTRAAGAMIAAESGFNTHAPIDCWIRGGRVAHVCYPTVSSAGVVDAALDHGALFLLTQQAADPVTRSGFADVVVADVGAPAGQYLGVTINAPAVFTDCRFERIVVDAGGREVNIGGGGAGITTTGTVDNRTPAQTAMATQTTRRYLAGNQTVANGGVTTVTLNTTDFTRGGGVDLATSGNGIKVTVAGVYLVSAETNFNGGAAGDRTGILRVNGITAREFGVVAAFGRPATATTLVLAANDLVELATYTTGGGPTTVNGDGFKDVGLTVTRLGA